jgi:hypothetical protein
MNTTALVSVLNRQESLTKSNYETLENLCELNFHRGILSYDEFSELVAYRDASFDEYAEFQVLAGWAMRNIQEAHFAYCLARKATPKENLLEGLSLLETVEGAELSLAPPLELIANSLTSHAPPIEPNSKSGTGSS